MFTQYIISIVSFSLAAALLVWFIVEEIWWQRNKSSKLFRKDNEHYRGCSLNFQIIWFIVYLIAGLAYLP